MSNNKNKSFATDNAIKRINNFLDEHKNIRLSILKSKNINKESSFYKNMYQMISTVFKYNHSIGMNVDSEMRKKFLDYPWKRPYFSNYLGRMNSYGLTFSICPDKDITRIEFDHLSEITKRLIKISEYKPRKSSTKQAKRNQLNASLKEFAKLVEKSVEDLFVKEYIEKLTSKSISSYKWTNESGKEFKYSPLSIDWIDKVLEGIEEEIEHNPEIENKDFGWYYSQSIIKWYSSIQKTKDYKFIDPLLRYVGRKFGESENEIIVNKTEKTGQEIRTYNVSSIRFGSEIEHILKHQLAAKRNPKLNKLFKLAFVERKLLEIDYQVKKVYTPIENKEIVKEECEHEGNFILCLDTSLSMTTEQMEIIKSISCSMAIDAMKRNRKCYIIEFSSGVKEFNAADPSCLDKFLEFLKESSRGGTNMEYAITRGIEIMKNENFSLSDILVVSDFEINEFNESIIKVINKQKEKGNRLFGLCLTKNQDDDHYSKILDNINLWIDQFWVYIEDQKNDALIADKINQLIINEQEGNKKK